MANFFFEGDVRTYNFVINQLKYLYHKKSVKLQRKRVTKFQNLSLKGSFSKSERIRQKRKHQSLFDSKRVSSLVPQSSPLLRKEQTNVKKRVSLDLRAKPTSIAIEEPISIVSEEPSNAITPATNSPPQLWSPQQNSENIQSSFNEYSQNVNRRVNSKQGKRFLMPKFYL